MSIYQTRSARSPIISIKIIHSLVSCLLEITVVDCVVLFIASTLIAEKKDREFEYVHWNENIWYYRAHSLCSFGFVSNLQAEFRGSNLWLPSRHPGFLIGQDWWQTHQFQFHFFLNLGKSCAIFNKSSLSTFPLIISESLRTIKVRLSNESASVEFVVEFNAVEFESGPVREGSVGRGVELGSWIASAAAAAAEAASPGAVVEHSRWQQDSGRECLEDCGGWLPHKGQHWMKVDLLVPGSHIQPKSFTV